MTQDALLGALITLIVFLVGSLIDNRRTIIRFRLDRQQELSREQRQFLYRQLSELYDPIYTLLSVNGNIITRAGPLSSSNDDSSYIHEEQKRVWDTFVSNVILTNNQRVCDIIESKLHLLSKSDNYKIYLEFVTHAYAYKVFREQRYEGYKKFQFPQGLLEHIETHRRKLQSEIEQSQN